MKNTFATHKIYIRLIQITCCIFLVLSVEAQDALFIHQNGNVGIGKTNPTQKLDVNGNAILNNVVVGDIGHGPTWAGFSHKSMLGAGKYALLQDHTGLYTVLNKKSGGGYIGFRVDNKDKMVMLDNGNFGIGKTNPIYKLDVNGSLNASSLNISGSTKLNGNNLRVEYSGESDINFVDTKNGQNWQVGTNEHGFYIYDNSYRFTVKKGGLVGIGTLNPTKAKLEIAGYSNPGNFHLYGFMDTNGTISNYNRTWGNYSNASIWASNDIIGGAIRVQSDVRIKKSIRNQKDNLSFVNQLRPVGYQYVDVIEKGERTTIGFIAQEVEKLDADLINKTKNFVPNIYAKAQQLAYNSESKSLRVSITQNHNCKVGDKVKIYTTKSKLELSVSEILSENELVLKDCMEPVESVFVYGKEVEDFMTIDYNGVFTKGIGAIQELSAKVDRLELQNQQLEEHISNLENQLKKYENQQNEIDQLKASVVLLLKAKNHNNKDNDQISNTEN